MSVEIDRLQQLVARSRARAQSKAEAAERCGAHSDLAWNQGWESACAWFTCELFRVRALLPPPVEPEVPSIKHGEQ
jgi:hypothetical protein